VRRRLPSLNALKAFEAAARHQSLAAAANELAVTHASVSRHVRELEEWLGTDLFIRSGRGVFLTPEGRRLGAALVQPFDLIAIAVDSAGRRSRANSLRVSVEPAIASRWLVPRLGRFADSHPEIDLAIVPTANLADLGAGEADVGIRYGPGAWDDLEVIKLADSWAFPVCSPQLIETHRIQKPQDIATCPLLVENNKRFWVDWMAAAGVRPVEGWSVTTFEAHLAIEAAEAGQGLALADFMLATDSLVAGRLVRPFDIEQKEDWSYYLVCSNGASRVPRVQAFQDWLLSEIEETVTRFSQHKLVQSKLPQS
jgi:LysR family glycine cleavage system transcriptional activator